MNLRTEKFGVLIERSSYLATLLKTLRTDSVELPFDK
jgi:hypothetical protein